MEPVVGSGPRGTKVLVRDQGNKGDVVIPYTDLDHLDRILARVFKIGG